MNANENLRLHSDQGQHFQEEYGKEGTHILLFFQAGKTPNHEVKECSRAVSLG
jgi:hypothetical protein